MGLIKTIFGDYSSREIKKIKPIVDKVLSYDEEYTKLSDEQLKNKTVEFKELLKNGKTLDDILPEAFAVVREAAWRTLGMKPYPVQIMGGIILHSGRIAEMKTGEGKTLVGTMPVYLNALEGKGVHVVTVNDYLAKRDKEWMGKIYEFLGLTVGVIIYGLDNKERQESYNCDITYGTNNQYGFDYLRDNMVLYKEDKVQRELNYAIVDEVDSILIDEARTPLIISGQGDESTDMYKRADEFVVKLEGRILAPEEDKNMMFERELKVETVDYIVDEKRKTASLTEVGTKKAESHFGITNLSDSDSMELAHHINQALKARYTMHKDINYVVKDDEILIVDEFTGRIMQGRRYSDGLHQAIEAKENVEVKSESKTLATITFQNYFRMFKKLSGMTGTAKTEEEEFREIYNMDVVEIPTNKPISRKDSEDQIYITLEEKFDAIVNEIEKVNKTGQPILVGTITIENSELLSKMLKKRNIQHQVLNAKFHEKEAEIVSQAGKFGTVTIATNMAGRGTDIILGGNPDALARTEMFKREYPIEIIEQLDSFLPTENEVVIEARKVYNEILEGYKIKTDEDEKKVLETGGLYIIGTERHESRRIDNQLRGRAGRQGDPGESKFFISLSDDLMRLFGGERVQSFLSKYSGEPDGEPIEAKMLSGAIERAQKKVESSNFGIRKHVLQYDDVMNKQRNVIYAERNEVLKDANMKESIMTMLESLIDSSIASYTEGKNSYKEWDIEGFVVYLKSLNLPTNLESAKDFENFDLKTIKEYLMTTLTKYYDEKEVEIGDELLRNIERVIVLRVVDKKWMDHIDAMDQLRQGIGLRAIGQVDPVKAYANEGYKMFEEMNYAIQEDVIRWAFSIQPEQKEIKREKVAKENAAIAANVGGKQETVVKGAKIGRNDQCYCGSGKKYKKCHGKSE